MNRTEYLLVCLMEEAAEIQQIASKCLRFGLDNYHPDRPETDNLDELQRELTDFDAIRFMLNQSGVVYKGYSGLEEMLPKIQKVTHFMEVSKACGTIAATDDPELLKEVSE